MMEERIDLKKLMLFFQKKIKFVLLAGVTGAIIGSSLYLLITALTAGPQEYRISYDFYVNFSDGTMEAHDYYNAYTWNDVLKKDFLLDETMKALEQNNESVSDQITGTAMPDKEVVAAALEATCPTDVKYLTVAVTYTDPVWAQRIADACVVSLKDFGIRMEEFDAIELINRNAVIELPKGQFSVRAMMTGMITFVILYILYFLFQYSCDDSIYLPAEFENRFGIRVLGMIVKNRPDKSTHGSKTGERNEDTFAKKMQKELLLNLDYAINNEGSVYICGMANEEQNHELCDKISEEAMLVCGEMNHRQKDSHGESYRFEKYDFQKVIFPLDQKSQYEKIRKSCGVILAMPCGMKNSKITEKLIHDLTIQDCKILGAILTGADGSFLRRYYHTFGKESDRE